MLIYIAINKSNKKIYVGQTVGSLANRKKSHMYEARARRINSYFHNALRKFGRGKFDWLVIRECKDQKELDIWEKIYIEVFNSQNKKYGYNLTDGGSSFKVSEKSRKKMSQSAKDRSKSKESIKRFLKAVQSPKARKKRIAFLSTRKGFKNPNYKSIDTERLKELYASNMLLEDIAKTLNIGENALRVRIKELGLTRKKPIRPETILLRKTKIQEKNNNWKKHISNESIRHLLEEGVNPWNIAKRLNYSTTTVTRRIKQMKLSK